MRGCKCSLISVVRDGTIPFLLMVNQFIKCKICKKVTKQFDSSFSGLHLSETCVGD